jgi:hypothetical protein
VTPLLSARRVGAPLPLRCRSADAYSVREDTGELLRYNAPGGVSKLLLVCPRGAHSTL